MNTTKEKILMTALDLFSKRGFSGVSVRDISGAVGVRESALYKHYSSKQDLFDSCLAEFGTRMKKVHELFAIPGFSQNESKEFLDISEEKLIQMAQNLFRFYLLDEVASKFRKMLMIEQYHNSEVAKSFQHIFIDAALEYETGVFRHYMDAGLFVEGSPEIAALHFYSPMFLLLQKYDTAPDEIEEALQAVEQHVRQFGTRYSKK